MKKVLPLCLLACVIAACGESARPAGGAGGLTLGSSEAVRAAVFLSSCIDDDSANEWLEWFYTWRSTANLLDVITSQASCFAGKTNGCGAVADCIGYAQTSDPACADGCVGTRARTCFGTVAFDIECGRLGLLCTAVGGRPTCVASAPSNACLPWSYPKQCRGDKPTFCDDTVEREGVSCAAQGADCVNGVCRGRGPACDPLLYGFEEGSGVTFRDGRYCEGDTLVACLDGHEHRVACGTLGPGATCQTVRTALAVTHDFCGVAGECALPDDSPLGRPSCDGSRLVVCNAGRIERIDCTALGFGRCLPLNGPPYAKCAP